jgi:hypothetical protein
MGAGKGEEMPGVTLERDSARGRARDPEGRQIPREECLEADYG